jgi:TonB family protein
MHENREISGTSWSADQDRPAKAINRAADANVQEKSDCAVLPMNQPNNEGQPSAEAGEGRAQTQENTVQSRMRPTQKGKRMSQGLAGVRKSARERKQERFTALLHHLSVGLLRDSFYALKRQASPGVDGMTWQEYETGLDDRLVDLHGRVHRRAYQARPSRRVCIPKADGRQGPLGIAALEDKIVQQAVVTILNQIYEVDFKWRNMPETVPNAESAAPITERRASRRLRLNSLIYVELGSENGGVATDISVDGLALMAAAAIGEDKHRQDLLNMRIRLPGLDRGVEATGQIAWRSRSRTGAGIKFVGLRTDACEQIRTWISSHRYEDTVEPSQPKSAEVEQPVPQAKDVRIPSSLLADTPQSLAEKDDEKQPVETYKALSGTQALRPQPVESRALSDGKEAVLSIRDPLFPKERRPDSVSVHGTLTLFPTPESPAKTSVNKRATISRLLSLPIGSIKVTRRLLRIAIAAAAILTLFAASRTAVRQITRRNGPTMWWTQNIPQGPVTRNSPGQNANVRSPVPARETVSNHQAVAPTPLAKTPTQTLNSTEFSGRALHPLAEPATQVGPTPWVPTSSLESQPVQTSESRPDQTREGTTQSNDSDAASALSNSSAVPAETSPTTDKEANAAPPKQPEASEPTPASVTVNPKPPAPGTPTETHSKKPPAPERLQKGHLITRVNPVYPAEAQRKGIEGPVKTHVVFSPEGAVTKVTFVSGPQELATAAMDAIRKWRYSPTLFDGKPVETEDNVTILFQLSKSQSQGSKKDKDEDEPM